MSCTQRIISSLSRLKISKGFHSIPSQIKHDNLRSAIPKLYYSNTTRVASATKMITYSDQLKINPRGDEPEAVKFLFLNNISDNPGAVKKVSEYKRVGVSTNFPKYNNLYSLLNRNVG